MFEKSLTIASQIAPGPPRETEKFNMKSSIGSSSALCRLLVHRSEEVLVRFGILHLVEKELHRVNRTHLHEDAAQHPHLGKGGRIDQQLFLAGAGLADVQRREDALVGDLAVEDDLGIAGALELLEDHLVHLRSEEHTSELQSLMRISYAVYCL